MTKTKTQKAGDPAAIAREGVAEWFENITTNRSPSETNFDDLIERVVKAVLASGEYGNARNDDDRRTEEEMAGRDAAYLIGVQMGLRMRDGGAR